jgi:hypothetical protein
VAGFEEYLETKSVAEPAPGSGPPERTGDGTGGR